VPTTNYELLNGFEGKLLSNALSFSLIVPTQELTAGTCRQRECPA
jgi:hypothetical protein